MIYLSGAVRTDLPAELNGVRLGFILTPNIAELVARDWPADDALRLLAAAEAA